MRKHSGSVAARAVAAAAALALTALAAGPVQAVQGGDTAEAAERGAPVVLPSLGPDLVAYYDFGHPVRGNPALERDRGRSGTDIELVNGGAAMRVPDSAFPGAGSALQTAQVSPATAGNDDWKAGVYRPGGVPSMRAFNGVQSATVMGWFKMTGDNPSPNSNTSDPDDRYGAIGLAGVLSGTSDGHGVRALLELIEVNGELRLVALGRRVDEGSSQTFAAAEDWRRLLPPDEWVFLAATFDYSDGTMALFRNGERLDGFSTNPGDPWQVGGPGEHRASPTDPAGIKIGGSFPQKTREANPCNCRMDSLMFLDRELTGSQVRAQYRLMVAPRS
ncbi:hypothetical protein AA958_27315 [Streptomyces sp. CNQ-509]|uniref:LamG-like jellyroll fold domain-containing protein n=1 Tax=Streptomyces sp. CNQ-509 TaxID=444103 RepID=UPI00062E0C67|nr:LamG-like jellyroll fold domain-containing protein [Streptomyces sp. CNQ-509]AKH85325.1 hypothetical protein AA958_27315 [Streptomyces sp. CNQ-509]